MEPTVVRLTSATTDVIVRCHPFAEILYWGPHLPEFIPEDLITLGRAVPNGRLDVDTPLTLAAESGRGLFGSPGVEGHRDGEDWSPIFTTRELTHHDNQMVILAEDPQAGLQLRSELVLDEASGVLKMRHTLINLQSARYWVNRLALTLPLPERASEVMAFHGRWIREFQPHRITLEHGGYLQENRRGRTSHEYFPGMKVGSSGFSEQQGEVWGVHLGWSGNHRLRADVKTDGRRLLQAEALYLPGEQVLEGGASLSTPWLYAAHSGSGLNALSQQFHRYVRQNILQFPDNKPRPVHLNTWEGIYFDHDPDYIMQMASQSAELGVERFIIDDGWFRGRDHDRAALGDWYLDKKKYPNGLAPVIEHVKHLGMEFGIWVEPEMINPDSDLFRAHPEWVLGLPGYQQPTGRFQYVLDLCHPQVFDYLLERMNWLLSNHDIDYIKWDMNREIVQPAHLGRASLTAQTEQFYRLLDTLRERFPQVEFESCASGGGRIDFEVLKRCHRFWASDNNDALERQTIQRGMSYFFPPEVMGAHIGNRQCHATERQHSISFRGLTALFGHMGIELDPVKEGEAEQQGFARYVALHKTLRPLLHSGNVIRIDHHDPSTQINGVIAEGQERAVILISQLAMPDYSLPGNLRIPGLKADGRYLITLLDTPPLIHQQQGGHTMRQLPGWMKQPCEVSGGWLAQVGLALPVLDPESAILIGLEQR
ncbi:alpha-galactosidase [Serratia fonticola]|uniref:Alpha-galactosidase n=1 Tax=Serratia fonticola TaxID=47917 RepID=A0A542CVR7_SERFO|nr:alpha-galactosidase [Serratia fonticola]TQI78085.1 alpha-galactosidase [Serratia fonticola]TQI94917.1 alpha-galactosidase [Serratia fonticola]TVZ69414.1 alpha-galactosidase [Serratia fonticola]